jgi:rod shape-determining protein MreD
MKPYLILLLLFVLALFQGAFLSLNFVLLVVLVWTAIRPIREAVLVAFLAGVFLDLARGTPLGLSSLIFLLVSFILSLYSRKYDPLHPAFLPVFTFLSAISYQLLTINYPDWREGLILALLVILARPLIGYFSLGSTRGEIKLKV